VSTLEVIEIDPEGGQSVSGSNATPKKSFDDSRDYEGWEQVPAAILKQWIVNPYWAEVVKAETLLWEF